MANFSGVKHLKQETFDSIAAGTHATQTYDANALYAVELDDNIKLATPGSGTEINANNELILSIPVREVD